MTKVVTKTKRKKYEFKEDAFEKFINSLYEVETTIAKEAAKMRKAEKAKKEKK